MLSHVLSSPPQSFRQSWDFRGQSAISEVTWHCQAFHHRSAGRRFWNISTFKENFEELQKHLAGIISLPVRTDRWEGLDLVLLGVLGLVDLDKEDVHLVNICNEYSEWNIFVKIIIDVRPPYVFEESFQCLWEFFLIPSLMFMFLANLIKLLVNLLQTLNEFITSLLIILCQMSPNRTILYHNLWFISQPPW